jgi:uncharacterized protein YjbJ (UPF0337 family)
MDKRRILMNWERVEDDWAHFKNRAKMQWGKLTEEDLEAIDGQRIELEGLLQRRYGYGKDQVSREIHVWLNRI